MKRSEHGFTLLELMIVIAVIGLLAIVLVPKAGTAKVAAKEAGLGIDMTYIQGHVIIQIDKYGINNRFPPPPAVHSGYDTDYLAGKLESILECNGSTETNEYNNFDGYQNPFSGNKTILGSSQRVRTFSAAIHQPAIYITRNEFYRYNPSTVFAESEKVNGTIILFMINWEEKVDLYYVDNNGKPCNYTAILP